MVSVGEFSPLPLAVAATFASPKSRTFTVPSGLILMLAGFRSRWMMPLLVRGFQRIGDLTRDAQGFVERHRPLRRSPSMYSITR